MMSLKSNIRRSSRSGLTLIELLVVVFIIVLFVALAAPLMRPNTNDTKLREAARQLNGYFAEAKAIAAQRAKNVALVFDRSATEGAQNPNIVTRLYLAESPPAYSGDTLSAKVSVWSETGQQPFPPELTNPINGVAPRVLVLDFTANNPMVDVISESYFSSTVTAIPFTIRLGNPGAPTTSGPWYPGLAIKGASRGIPGGRPIQYFILAQYNQPWHKLAPPAPPSPYPTPPHASSAVFQVNFPPQNSSSSNLELPTGTCVDLNFSGYQYYDYTVYPPATEPAPQAEPTNPPASFQTPLTETSPLYIVFGPGGDVQYVLGPGPGGINYQPTRMNFLVGTTDRAIDSVGDASYRTSNLNDRAGQWVTVTARTGFVSTADNAGFDSDPPDPPDPTMAALATPEPYRGTAIGRARAMAAGLNTKGGR